MNKKIGLFFLLFVLVFSACRRQKTATSVPTKSDLKKVTVQQIDFTYFSAKSRVSYRDAAQNLTASLTIRMKKDSILWLSVSKLGIEGLRGIITQDSIFIDNKLKKEFLVYDFASLSKKLNFDLSFGLIQAAILGNLPVARSEQDKLMKDGAYYLLRQREDSVVIDNYISPENLKLTKVLAVEQPTRTSLTLDYENFNALNDFLFPYTSILSLSYASSPGEEANTTISIEHNKVEISNTALRFPFDALKKY